MIILRNRKGSIQDLMFLVVIVFVFAIVTLFAFKFMDSFNNEIQAMDEIPNDAKTSTTSLMGNFSGVIDNSFLFLVIGMGIVTIIFAAMVRIHPIFIALFLLCLVFTIFLSAVFSNVYEAVADNDQMIGVSSQLTGVNLIFSYLPIIIGVFGSILCIIMYVSYKEGN
jgi:hypothetical protein